jgi:hypothetical protein
MDEQGNVSQPIIVITEFPAEFPLGLSRGNLRQKMPELVEHAVSRTLVRLHRPNSGRWQKDETDRVETEWSGILPKDRFPPFSPSAEAAAPFDPGSS